MQPCLLRENRYFKPDDDLVVINTEDDGGVPGKRAAKGCICTDKIWTFMRRSRDIPRSVCDDKNR